MIYHNQYRLVAGDGQTVCWIGYMASVVGYSCRNFVDQYAVVGGICQKRGVYL